MALPSIPSSNTLEIMVPIFEISVPQFSILLTLLITSSLSKPKDSIDSLISSIVNT